MLRRERDEVPDMREEPTLWPTLARLMSEQDHLFLPGDGVTAPLNRFLDSERSGVVEKAGASSCGPRERAERTERVERAGDGAADPCRDDARDLLLEPPHTRPSRRPPAQACGCEYASPAMPSREELRVLQEVCNVGPAGTVSSRALEFRLRPLRLVESSPTLESKSMSELSEQVLRQRLGVLDCLAAFAQDRSFCCRIACRSLRLVSMYLICSSAVLGAKGLVLREHGFNGSASSFSFSFPASAQLLSA